ncbi:MAG: hypothetical protein ABW164_08510 [Sphingobium sp.]
MNRMRSGIAPVAVEVQALIRRSTANQREYLAADFDGDIFGKGLGFPNRDGGERW